MKHLWQKLRYSLAPVHMKSRAVRVAAWPRALRGVAATTLSDTVFDLLRSEAMRGLQADGPGCNPMIHLGLVEPALTDPVFWSIMQTIRDARLSLDWDGIRYILRDTTLGLVDPPRNGPTMTMLRRLDTLGWRIGSDGLVYDSLGAFDLFHISLPELALRAEWSWLAVVSEHVRERKFFHGLHWADVQDTRRWLTMLDGKDAATFRKLLNGAFFTADHAAHWNETGDDTCKHCGCTETRFHRFWECPAFAHCRDALSPGVAALVPTLPEALTSAGWSMLPSTHLEWKRYLCGLSEFWIGDAYQLRGVGRWADIFPDGSCFHQGQASCRYAGWAVVEPHVSGDVERAQVVAKGPLPGLLQSSFRAELYAVLQALQLAVVGNLCLRIWCDNSGVVSGIQRICATGKCPSTSGPNSDLWCRVFHQICLLGWDSVIATHIHSHQPAEGDAFQQWVAEHNGLADRMAVVANQQRDPWVLRLHASHCSQTQVVRRINREIQRVQLRVSQELFRADPEVATVELPSVVPAGGPFYIQLAQDLPAPMVLRYGMPYLQLLHGWLVQVLADDEFWTGETRWMSSMQLYIDWHLTSGLFGQLCVNGRWKTLNVTLVDLLPQYKFKTLCKWWTQIFGCLLTAMGNQLVRRRSMAADVGERCLKLSAFDGEDQHFSKKLSRACSTSHTKELGTPQVAVV
eukprot:Skav233714  [mRNA]  locus=scaffold2120:172713:176089:+ [translate_table: standard]